MPIPRFNTIRLAHQSSSAQAAHHLNTRAVRCIPAKAGATTTLPIREVSTRPNASIPPLPAHHDHHSSAPTPLVASHLHSLRIVAELLTRKSPGGNEPHSPRRQQSGLLLCELLLWINDWNETGWPHFACRDRFKDETWAAGFARASARGRIQVLGRRWVEVVQRMEVMRMEGRGGKKRAGSGAKS